MEIRRLIEGRTSSDIISCALDIPVREAIALLASKRIGAINCMVFCNVRLYLREHPAYGVDAAYIRTGVDESKWLVDLWFCGWI